MHSMKIKRPLPPSPPTATKMVHNNQIYGYGKNTYEASVPSSQIEIRIPPQKSNSQAAQVEREMKIILDLAREGKTATEIAEESGYNRNRVVQVVNRFAEYGAKLKPEPKKIKAKNPDPGQYRSKWTPEETEILMDMREAGCTWAEIGEKLGRTDTACRIRWGRENERRINHSSVFHSVDSGRQSDRRDI